MSGPKVILASTSTYRRMLLMRLGLDFDCVKPDVCEAPLMGEGGAALVVRLSEAKARSVATDHPEAVIIGSDQVAVLDRNIVGKPGTVANAVAQLRQASGRQVVFYTGVCCLLGSGACQVDVVTTRVTFQTLDEDKICRYVARDLPLDCAGSFKSEGLGVTLFDKIEGEDPSALIGLPLIRLCRMLEQAGVIFY
ncbi:MAG: septum formation inhibitor Maf [Nitrospirae bacterium]|nr:septum formation inhibitor Maf [Magnetococcales bacterium]HAT48762.1 septum formation inhibitor Maf [Alphaproteobacteria bacterium]